MNNARANTPDASESWLDRRANRGRTHFRRHSSFRERSREQALKDWYGAAEGVAEIVAHQSRAVPIADVVAEVLAGFGMQDALLLDELREKWPALVGADIARRTHPVMIQRGVLHIEVTGTTWCYVLEREHKTRILAEIRRVGAEQVTALRFVPLGRNPGRRS